MLFNSCGLTYRMGLAHYFFYNLAKWRINTRKKLLQKCTHFMRCTVYTEYSTIHLNHICFSHYFTCSLEYSVFHIFFQLRQRDILTSGSWGTWSVIRGMCFYEATYRTCCSETPSLKDDIKLAEDRPRGPWLSGTKCLERGTWNVLTYWKTCHVQRPNRRPRGVCFKEITLDVLMKTHL